MKDDFEDTAFFEAINRQYLNGMRHMFAKYPAPYVKAIELEGIGRRMDMSDPQYNDGQPLFNSPLEWLLIHNPRSFRNSSEEVLHAFSMLEEMVVNKGLQKVNPQIQENVRVMVEEINDLIKTEWDERVSRLQKYFDYKMLQIENKKHKAEDAYLAEKDKLIKKWESDYRWLSDPEYRKEMDELFQDIFCCVMSLDGHLGGMYSLGDNQYCADRF